FATFVKNFKSRYGDIFELYMLSERQIWLCCPSLVNEIFTNSTQVVVNRNLKSWKCNHRILSYILTNIKVLKESVKIVKKLFTEIEIYRFILNNENNLSDKTVKFDEFMVDL
ncbi:14380_t:CDS:2, partial [Racocetra fulgida]